jgi:hypothetical protein
MEPVAAPAIAGQSYVLMGVAAISAGNAWAVGSITNREILAEHWDGTSWHLVPAPAPGCGSLSGVSVLRSGHAWAVGALILHWNGSSWQHVPLT